MAANSVPSPLVASQVFTCVTLETPASGVFMIIHGMQVSASALWGLPQPVLDAWSDGLDVLRLPGVEVAAACVRLHIFDDAPFTPCRKSLMCHTETTLLHGDEEERRRSHAI